MFRNAALGGWKRDQTVQYNELEIVVEIDTGRGAVFWLPSTVTGQEALL